MSTIVTYASAGSAGLFVLVAAIIIGLKIKQRMKEKGKAPYGAEKKPGDEY